MRQEQPLTLIHSEPEPDVAVVRGTQTDFIHRHTSSAELVIEIAVTSHDYDRDKAAAYAAAGIPEFWIVLVPERQIEVYREPENGAYRHMEAQQGEAEVSSSCVAGFSIKPAELFAGL